MNDTNIKRTDLGVERMQGSDGKIYSVGCLRLDIEINGVQTIRQTDFRFDIEGTSEVVIDQGDGTLRIESTGVILAPLTS